MVIRVIVVDLGIQCFMLAMIVVDLGLNGGSDDDADRFRVPWWWWVILIGHNWRLEMEYNNDANGGHSKRLLCCGGGWFVVLSLGER